MNLAEQIQAAKARTAEIGAEREAVQAEYHAVLAELEALPLWARKLELESRIMALQAEKYPLDMALSEARKAAGGAVLKAAGTNEI